MKIRQYKKSRKVSRRSYRRNPSRGRKVRRYRRNGTSERGAVQAISGERGLLKNPSSSSRSDVRSPTSTRTEVRSPTSTRTEVRSPTSTSTSTRATTKGNFTVTGGAGAGNTTINFRRNPAPRRKNPAPKILGQKQYFLLMGPGVNPAVSTLNSRDEGKHAWETWKPMGFNKAYGPFKTLKLANAKLALAYKGKYK